MDSEVLVHVHLAPRLKSMVDKSSSLHDPGSREQRRSTGMKGARTRCSSQGHSTVTYLVQLDPSSPRLISSGCAHWYPRNQSIDEASAIIIKPSFQEPLNLVMLTSNTKQPRFHSGIKITAIIKNKFQVPNGKSLIIILLIVFIFIKMSLIKKNSGTKKKRKYSNLSSCHHCKKVKCTPSDDCLWIQIFKKLL